MDLPAEKLEIAIDGLYRSRLADLARTMIEDLETEESPEYRDAILKLTHFAEQIEKTIDVAMGNFVLAPKAFMQAPQPDGSKKWLQDLTAKLDEYLVYPEKKLLFQILDIVANYKQDSSRDIYPILDALLQLNLSLLGETFINTLISWSETEIAASKKDPDNKTFWGTRDILDVVLYMGNFFKKSSSFYGAICYRVAIACYETLIKYETDAKKIQGLNELLAACRQGLGNAEQPPIS